MKFRLTAEVEAQDENEAATKFMGRIMFMLVNDVEESGSMTLRIEEAEPAA